MVLSIPADAKTEVTSSGISDSLLCVGCIELALTVNMAVPRKFGSAKQVSMAYAQNVAYAKVFTVI